MTKSYGELLVLDNVSFEVKKGEFLCIVGPTGCGKTTFLNSLTKLHDIDSGEILLDSVPVNLKKQSIAYIFQENSVLSWRTVAENVALGLEFKKKELALTKNEIKKKVRDALSIVGLLKFENYYPNQLSASMLQRVVIARAFVIAPELLLMDEPYGQLDINLRFRLEDEVVKICKQFNTTVIFITHNLEEAVYVGDRILILTNKPSKIKEELENPLPRPRDVTSSEFIKLREYVTDQIRWW
nr:ABC transporter ATP-binding protein [Mediterraneibacter hominis]